MSDEDLHRNIGILLARSEAQIEATKRQEEELKGVRKNVGILFEKVGKLPCKVHDVQIKRALKVGIGSGVGGSATVLALVELAKVIWGNG